MRSLKIYEAGKRNETLWQIIRDNMRYPDAALGRPARADRLLPARRAALRRTGRALRPRDGRGLHRQASGTRPRPRRAPWSRKSPTATTRPRASSTTTAAISTSRCASRSRCSVSRLADDGRFLRDEPAGAGPAQFRPRRAASPARAFAFKALTSPDLDVNEGCFRPLDVDAAGGHHAAAPGRRRRSGCGASRCRP